MNVTSLFLGGDTHEALTHIRNAASGTTRSAQELATNVSRLRSGLARAGVRELDPVLVLCGSRVEVVEVLLAVFGMGAIAMPANPLLGTANLLEIIGRMKPTCCFFEDSPEATIRQALTDLGCLMVSLKATRGSLPTGGLAYDDLVACDTGVSQMPQLEDSTPALIIHGSGSSGKQKAVTMSHGDLLRFFEYHNYVYSQYSDGPGTLRGTSAMVTALPLSHLAGIATCLQGLMNRRRTYILSFFLPDTYLELVERARCSFIMLMPSLYRRLLASPYMQRMDRSALRFCITGGEPASDELLSDIESRFGVPVVTAYSMTECLSGIGHLRQDLFAGRITRGSAGKQLFGELTLRDGSGVVHPSEGELWVRNPTVHRCYLDAELNAKHLCDGWFRTGDLFHKDPDGHYFHRGRVDDMFICRGKNIYPIEMELLLARHPAVEAVCAAPVITRTKLQVPAALVVCRSDVSESDIQAFSSQNGPSHSIPQIVRFAETLPQLGPGKVDRRRVTQILQQACESAGL